MKICYFGDISWHELKWAEYFVKKGHEVTFVTYGKGSKVSKDFSFNLNNVKIFSISFINVKNNYFRSFINNIFLVPYNWFLVKKYIKIIKPDIIHAHSVKYGYFAALTGFRPYVFTPMGSDIIIYARKHFVYRIFAKIAYKYAEIITGDSNLIRDIGISLGAKENNNHIIQNGVDRLIFNSLINKDDSRKDLGLLENVPIILSTRSFLPLYNIVTIIKAIPEVLIKYPEALFVFVYGASDEDYYNMIKRLIINLSIKNNIALVGFVEYSQLPKYYASSNVYISIPFSDSSPKSVYEAFASGVPCIINSLPWNKNFILNKKHALLTNTKPKEKELSDGIIHLIDNKIIREKIVNNAHLLFEKYLDYDKNMKRMEVLMESLFNNEKNRSM